MRTFTDLSPSKRSVRPIATWLREDHTYRRSSIHCIMNMGRGWESESLDQKASWRGRHFVLRSQDGIVGLPVLKHIEVAQRQAVVVCLIRLLRPLHSPGD